MLRCLAVLLIAAGVSAAQEVRRESIVVTGTAEPVPLEEADRSVVLLPVRDDALLSNSLTDLLRLVPSLDVQARAPGGVQTDVSIRGGNFGQTLILLNGLRLNDAQSGHHDMDIPIPLQGVERIEVLRGSGSTLYGSDAVGGVVNIIATPPEGAEFRLRTAVGDFGVNQQSGSLAGSVGRLSEQLVFSRDFSSGFRPDRDYRNLAFSSVSHVANSWGASDITLAYDDKPFGADQFYGNFNSWENTKTWFAGLRQGLGANTSVDFAFRRHSDLFVLYRDRPEVFANHHSDETWQLSLRRRNDLGHGAVLHYGVEGFHDSILSSNLGDHARSRGAAYAGVDIRALRRFSFSAGAREEVYRAISGTFSPTVAGGVWLSARIKLRASASRAFRVPSYTDLYYHDPANLGSPNLRPERAWSYEAGMDWNGGDRIRGDVTVFERRERDVIDYVRRSPNDIWRATNFQSLNFTGVEAGVTIMPTREQRLDFRYTGLHGAEEALGGGIQSKYVFNYPSHSGVAAWQASLPAGILLRTRVGVLNRLAREPYGLWDVYAACTRGRVHPFVQATNLANTGYQEIPGVVMPGRAIIGGVEWVVWSRR